MVLGLAIVFGGIGIAIATITVSNINFTSHEQKSESALQISEAGVNYYLWHMSHNATDYQDGTGSPASPPYGPYTHDYTDCNGKNIGTYTLYITPPSPG